MKSCAAPTAILAVLALSALASPLAAGVPGTLTYQGLLTDENGTPITSTMPIAFRLYNSITGGSPFWSETQTVTLIQGRLSAILGANSTDNPLPRDAFSGETYIELQPDGDGDGVLKDTDLPMARQRFSSVAYAFRAAYAEDAPIQIPTGVIVMWSGAVTAVPNGWVLCNGQNGTPDLRDRFIVGAGGGYAVASTGGTSINNISHTHPIAAESPRTNHVENHAHSYSGRTDGDPGDINVRRGSGDPVGSKHNHAHAYSGTTSDEGGHSHSVNSHDHGGGTHPAGATSLENRPPYYALAFIMKQ